MNYFGKKMLPLYQKWHVLTISYSLSQVYVDLPSYTHINLAKGPFKYYVSKKVCGWGMPNAYVFLHGGWVGLARCLRNQKKKLEKKGKLKKR